jgi:anti-sigma factor RsiW
MKTFENGHVEESALELYALGRLGDHQSEELEEHILLCGSCQRRLQDMDDFIRSFRAAAARFPEAMGPENEEPSRGILARRLDSQLGSQRSEGVGSGAPRLVYQRE